MVRDLVSLPAEHQNLPEVGEQRRPGIPIQQERDPDPREAIHQILQELPRVKLAHPRLEHVLDHRIVRPADVVHQIPKRGDVFRKHSTVLPHRKDHGLAPPGLFFRLDDEYVVRLGESDQVRFDLRLRLGLGQFCHLRLVPVDLIRRACAAALEHIGQPALEVRGRLPDEGLNQRNLHGADVRPQGVREVEENAIRHHRTGEGRGDENALVRHLCGFDVRRGFVHAGGQQRGAIIRTRDVHKSVVHVKHLAAIPLVVHDGGEGREHQVHPFLFGELRALLHRHGHGGISVRIHDDHVGPLVRPDRRRIEMLEKLRQRKALVYEHGRIPQARVAEPELLRRIVRPNAEG